MSRLRYAGVTGTIGSGNLTNSATSHTFTAPLTYGNGVTLPTLAGSDTFLLTILDTSGNLSEVISVTAYNQTTGAATIVRGQEGTSGVAHTSGDKVTMSAYASDFPTLDAYPMIAGQFYSDPNGVGVSTTTPTSGRLEMRPFPVGVTGAVDQLAAECAVTGTCQYRLGIYDSDTKTGMPRNLIVDAGVVSATSTGARTLTVSLTLTPGLYWLAALSETPGTGTFRSWSTQTVAGRLGWSAVVSGSMYTELVATGVSSGAMPSPCPAVAGFATTTGIRVFARAA